MSDAATTLDRLAARAGQLYSLPAVAMKVLELTNNPEVDTRALKECIENDPALTGKILRVVNSSLFGLSRQVSDLNQALALLGTKPLKLLVLGFSLPGGLFSGVTGEVLGRYWRHTLTKAVAGREISETLWQTPGDDAFIAGLLQDLGMLLLIQELGEPYVKFLDKVWAGRRELAALEAELLGFDHTALSARLLVQWGLPQGLVDAVAWKSNGRWSDARRSEQVLPQVLHLAELLTRLLADQQQAVLGELLEVGREYRQLSDAQLESLVGNLGEKVSQLADVLNLQLPAGVDYRDVLVQAHAQLAVVANEAAADLLRGGESGPASPDEDSLWLGMHDLAEVVAKVSRPRPEPCGAVAAAPPEPAAVATVPVPPSARHAQPTRGRTSETAAADPELLGRLAVAAAACRQSRCPLSLLLVELDRVEELAATRSEKDFAALRRFLETTCRNLDHPFKICVPHGTSGFALILPNCERRLAVESANQLVNLFRRLMPQQAGKQREGVSLSVGAATVALPPRNFPPEDLFSGAGRCLYASHASGGGVVKSIEIY